MTDRHPNERGHEPERHPQAGHGNAGAWQPVPGGADYDPDQTMHVSFAAQLPPEPRPGEDPLGAHGPAGDGYQPLDLPDYAGYQAPYYGAPGGTPVYGQQRPAGGHPHEDAGRRGPRDPGGQGHPGGPNPRDPQGGYGADPAAGAAPGNDPATSWTIPVIRDDAENDSGEYSVGAFAQPWDDVPPPAPGRPSRPAGLFGQGAAAAQAAQARAAEARAAEAAAAHGAAGPGDAEPPAHPGPADFPGNVGAGGWSPSAPYEPAGDYAGYLPADFSDADFPDADLPDTGLPAVDPWQSYAGTGAGAGTGAEPDAPRGPLAGYEPAEPYGGGAVDPWLPAAPPAADGAWSGVVDDPDGPAPASHTAGTAPSEAPASEPTAREAAGHPVDAPGAEAGEPVPDAPAAAEYEGGPEGHLPPSGSEGDPYAAAPELNLDPHPVARTHPAPAPSPSPEQAADGPGPEAPRHDVEDAAAPRQEREQEQELPEEGLAEDRSREDGQAEDAPSDGALPEPPGLHGLPELPEDAFAGALPEAAADGTASDPEPAPDADPAPVPETRSEHPLASYMLRVNGTERPVTDAWLGESLLYVLRERLGLAGAKDGCEQGECGACSVQVDGRLVASCLVPAATAAGSEVRTVEGLAADGRPSDVQRALAECGAVQCGFCIPGMAMTVHDLLEGNHRPTDLDIRSALSGNLCRCSGYRGVIEAVRTVVAEREADDGAGAAQPGDEPGRVPHQLPHQGGPGTPGTPGAGA
ncbi:(2Fe-2S)-binding protein [Actinacidiphila yeochonensis]|uniref:(2Fe-2S)-binding protein n=1 Tax=Actinacidiphila yeochonensis TaxID=89050 RepID=UPI00068A034C|nr:(2Fe-2S)-binding protein [Actinacidiphila yeochonensis]